MPCHYEDKAHAADMKRKIQMTEHKRVKARPLPAKPAAARKLPDFLARLKRLYRGRTLAVSGAELLASERERF